MLRAFLPFSNITSKQIPLEKGNEKSLSGHGEAKRVHNKIRNFSSLFFILKSFKLKFYFEKFDIYLNQCLIDSKISPAFFSNLFKIIMKFYSGKFDISSKCQLKFGMKLKTVNTMNIQKDQTKGIEWRKVNLKEKVNMCDWKFSSFINICCHLRERF